MDKHNIRGMASVAMGAALLAVCAWIAVPTAIPFTLQTFGVCLVAALLGLRGGLWTVAVYLLLGAVGAPVFSGFRGGFGALLGATGAFGTAWFVLVYSRGSGAVGVGTALSWCVLPYLLPDAVKIALAAILARRLYPILRKEQAT